MDTLWGISKITQLLHSCTVGTCEFFLAAIPYTLLQILKLMFHLLILPLGLLTLSPEQRPKKHNTCVMRTKIFVLIAVKKTTCNWPIT